MNLIHAHDDADNMFGSTMEKLIKKLALKTWRDIVDAMRTCDQTRQAIVKLNMAYVYRLRRAGFLERLGVHFLAGVIKGIR